jgi:hypothetical protein
METCEGVRGAKHEPIAWNGGDQPWRCPMCDLIEEKNTLEHRLATMERDLRLGADLESRA